MQYITTGNRIAVENFVLGDLYTITFTSGTYINSACIGIGENFVSFQRNEPELLFTLNMETAELVSSIDLYAGGTGTNNYNELTNKPQIGGVELVGNKSLSDLGIQAEITEESPLSSSLVSGLGSAAAADSSDFATAAQGALAESAIQSAGTGLTKDGTTLNHSNAVTAQTSASFSSITFDAQGHITGSTAATTAQLNAINSGITSTDVAQIETNKTNILSSLDADGQKNIYQITNVPTVSGITISKTDTNTMSINGTFSSATYVFFTLSGNNVVLPAGSYVVYTKTTGTMPARTLTITSDVASCTLGSYAEFTLATDKQIGVYVQFLSNDTVNGTISIMICPKSLWDISHKYEPYAMTNAEITAWILAHS